MIDFCGITVLRLMVSRNSEEIPRNFSPQNSSEFLRNPEIPEKFLGLGHHVYGFLGEFILRTEMRHIVRE